MQRKELPALPGSCKEPSSWLPLAIGLLGMDRGSDEHQRPWGWADRQGHGHLQGVEFNSVPPTVLNSLEEEEAPNDG